MLGTLGYSINKKSTDYSDCQLLPQVIKLLVYLIPFRKTKFHKFNIADLIPTF